MIFLLGCKASSVQAWVHQGVGNVLFIHTGAVMSQLLEIFWQHIQASLSPESVTKVSLLFLESLRQRIILLEMPCEQILDCVLKWILAVCRYTVYHHYLQCTLGMIGLDRRTGWIHIATTNLSVGARQGEKKILLLHVNCIIYDFFCLDLCLRGLNYLNFLTTY